MATITVPAQMPELERDFYVYVYFRPWNGQPCYVGKGRGRRWLKHLVRRRSHHNRHFRAILDKAERMGLAVPVIKVREGLSHVEALEIEMALIAAIGRRCDGGPLCNKTAGGEGIRGLGYTEEHRHKIGAASRRNFQRPEVRIKHRENIKMALAQPDIKAKHKAGLRRKWKDDPDLRERHRIIMEAIRARGDVSAKISARLKGRPKSAIAKRNMAAAANDPVIKERRRQGLLASYAQHPERRAKLSAIRKGQKRTDETKKRIAAAVAKRWADRKSAGIFGPLNSNQRGYIGVKEDC